MLELAKISSKGQITVPIGIRQTLGVKSGDKVIFIVNEGEVTIANAASIALDRIQTAFAGAAQRWGVQNEEDVVAMIKEIRHEENSCE